MLYIVPRQNIVYEIVLNSEGKLKVFTCNFNNPSGRGFGGQYEIYNSFTEFENFRPPSVGYYFEL